MLVSSSWVGDCGDVSLSFVNDDGDVTGIPDVVARSLLSLLNFLGMLDSKEVFAGALSNEELLFNGNFESLDTDILSGSLDSDVAIGFAATVGKADFVSECIVDFESDAGLESCVFDDVNPNFESLGLDEVNRGLEPVDVVSFKLACCEYVAVADFS